MKLKISDMMDHVETIPVDFGEKDIASVGRIKEATMKKIRNAKSNNYSVKKWGTMAACFCLCGLLGVGVWQSNMFNNTATPNDTNPSVNLPQTEQSSDENPNIGTTPILTPDDPIQSEVGNGDALTAYEDIWGGSYLDTNGNWVVWITEDTDENRAEVFKKNPELNQDNIEFKTADYSLAYLTQLMADISKAMSNGQLPFVSSASLMETTNRVEVTVTDESADLVAEVLAFDTVGGAIEIKFAAAAVYG